MNNVYTEHPGDTWSSNGVSYNLNKLFQIAHDKPTQMILTKEFELQVDRSKKNVDGQMVCGSCYGHTKDILKANKHHEERVQQTDISIPIIALKDEGDWRVVDGAHRVEKALLHSIEVIPVKVLTLEEIQSDKGNVI